MPLRRPLTLAAIALLIATPASAMGQRPARTPAEQAAAQAAAARAEARHGEVEPALNRLATVARVLLAAPPIDPAAACALAEAQRACVHEAARRRTGGRWLALAARGVTDAVASQRRLASSLLGQARTARRPGEAAYGQVMNEVMAAWLDQFPEIDETDPAFTLDPDQAARERALPRDRYRVEALALFRALRANVQTDAEAAAFKAAFKRTAGTVRDTHRVMVRLDEMLGELRGLVEDVPVVPPGPR